eukprot:10200419-Karenia_brevis.AAC.1
MWGHTSEVAGLWVTGAGTCCDLNQGLQGYERQNDTRMSALSCPCLAGVTDDVPLADLAAEAPAIADSTELVFFPEGHGKGACDGQGGRKTEWLENAAKKTLVDTLDKYCAVLNAQAKLAEGRNPCMSKSVFHAFVPPTKSTIPKPFLDSAQLRKENMGMKSTYAWSGSNSAKGDQVLRRHPFAGEPCDKFIVAPTVKESPTHKEDDMADDGDWRWAYRTKFPEKLDLGSDEEVRYPTVRSARNLAGAVQGLLAHRQAQG